ncbi:MAG: energy-coupling factor ABC transporter permease [Candidatus Firestonebacteria bacterium]|nr:energy-coupling factor ABC transporter permease [Candidatus Firestonebacteria bacterium]
MHMADALISPAVGISFWTCSIGVISFCAHKLKIEFNDKIIPLMGVMGAFIFAGQMINFTIPGTGSSGHIGGGMLLAIILGPYAGFITIASVLFIQALFFADGGLLALGCNIWNLGIYPCFIAYPLIYKLIAGNSSNNKKIMIGSILGVILGLELGAFSVVMETVFSGITELPFLTFSKMVLPIHLLIAVIEGIVTGAIIIYVKNIQPDLFYADNQLNNTFLNLKKVLLSIGVLALITGGILSWFASTHPDGLEWSMGKITGREELLPKETVLHKNISRLQEKIAFLPDYSFGKQESKEPENKKESWPSVSGGTSVSGIIGGIFTLGLTILIGFVIKLFRKRSLTNTQ